MWIDGLSVYDKKTGSIGNGRLWMALLQKRLLGKKAQDQIPQTELNQYKT